MSAIPLRIVPPAESGRVVVVAPDDRGLLHLLWAAHDGNSRHYAWSGIATSGMRDLRMQAGTFVPVAGESPADRLLACATGPRSSPVPAHAFDGRESVLRHLGSFDGGDRQRLDAFLAVCGGASPLLACLGTDPAALAPLDARHGTAAVDAFVARYPALVDLVDGAPATVPDEGRLADEATLLSQGAAPEAIAGAAWRLSGLALARMAEGMGALYPAAMPAPEPEPGALRRLLRALDGTRAAPADAVVALRLLGNVPRDWTPATAEAVSGMACVLLAVLHLCRLSDGALDPETLLAPVRGDWERAAASLRRHAPAVRERPQDWASYVADMARAYDAQVLRPAAAYACAALGRPADELPGLPQAWRALFAGKGVLAVAEASADWHSRGSAMTAMIAALGGLSSDRFPRPFEDFVAFNGLAVVPILTAAELVEEGRALRHCVGSYAGGCLAGSYAIASVRDPQGRRLSTVQIAPSGAVREHRAHGNAEPGQAERAAVDELSRSLRASGGWRRKASVPLRELPARLVRRIRDGAAPRSLRDGGFPYNPGDPLRVMRAASVWERYLPRSARGSMPALLDGPAPGLAVALAKHGTLRPVGTPMALARSALALARSTGAQLVPAAMVAGSLFLFIKFAVFVVENAPDPGAARHAQGVAIPRAEYEKLAQVRHAVTVLGEAQAGARTIAPDDARNLRARFEAINATLPAEIRIPDLRLAIAAEEAAARRKAAAAAAPARAPAR